MLRATYTRGDGVSIGERTISQFHVTVVQARIAPPCLHAVTVVRRIPAPASARIHRATPGRADATWTRAAGRTSPWAGQRCHQQPAHRRRRDLHPRRARRRDQLHRHRRRLFGRRAGGDRRQGAGRRQARRRRARDQSRLSDRRRSEPARGVPPPDHPRRRGLVAAAEPPTGSTSIRYIARIRARTSTRHSGR